MISPQPEADTWCRLSEAEVVERLASDPVEGLASAESTRRLNESGPNRLEDRAARSAPRILRDQVLEPMVLLLVVAVGVSWAIGESTDALAILVIVLINTVLGFVQDYRAEKAMAALMRRTIPLVRVRRDGEERDLNADELVCGDVVLLESGNRVPADGRILESHQLRVAEAALTGESAPVDKEAGGLDSEHVVLADQTNMVFMGTEVSSGRAEIMVTRTGMETQLGKVAGLMQGIVRGKTPLQKRLATLGLWLAAAALAIVALVFVIGLWREQDTTLMFMTALSMAVAAVPEGLPAVATVALALGGRRMMKRQALVRKLAAVETLGSVSVICCDKTGTLTENRMRVATLALSEASFDCPKDMPPSLARELLLSGLAVCNDASGDQGDPTELALLEVVERAGDSVEDLRATCPRKVECPFDSDRKRMTTVHVLEGKVGPLECEKVVGFTKGAVSSVLNVCNQVLQGDQITPMTAELHAHLLQLNDALSGEGKRVLGMAYRLHDVLPEEDGDATMEEDLCFVGMVGMIDPPRADAKEAVLRCQSAGIRPIMITGDHGLTATFIASQLGITEPDGRVITGEELMTMSDQALDDSVDQVSVFARVSPEHKLRIVQSLKRQGHVVAMTGDGVNDAPSLKEADIGVAMGITGTDVAKEASEMVLMDDHFSTIVTAVEEGRLVYDNIRKFLKYTMTSNAGEIWVMLLAPLLGMPLPLLPLQILWINLVTDGLPGLALSLEPAERELMQRAPRPVDEPVFDRSMLRHLLVIGFLMGIVTLLLGFAYWSGTRTTNYDPSWGTIVFTVLTLSQMGHALAIRSSRESLFQLGLSSNVPLLGAVLLTFAAQMGIVYLPWFQEVFGTVALSAKDLVVCLLASTLVFWAVELEKWLKRRAE
jgi:P-type Ca2+ transporter type 2C